MCEFFSALVTRQGNFVWDPATDSHADLIDSCGLRNVQNSECSHFAKIEFTPRSMDKADDIDSYTLRIDEYNEPAWIDDEMRETIIRKCRSIVSGMIITGEHKCILSGKYILGKNAKVERAVNSNIVAMLESSQVGTMWGSSQVGTMWGSSQVGTMWGSSRVGEMRESSQVGEMRGSSRVGTMRESSQVGEMRGSSQVGTMWGSSRVGEMRESSQVGEMRGSSSIKNDQRIKEAK